ncbi:hypothetical protein MY1884_009723 [Beauveria asiatica]
MISAFASSLVALDGFNATEPEGKPSNVGVSVLSAIKQSVFCSEPYHAKNISDAKTAFQDRLDFKKKVAELAQFQRRIADRALTLKEEFELSRQGRPVRTARERIAELAELERQMAEVEAQVESTKKQLNLAEGLLRNWRPLIDFLIKKGLLLDDGCCGDVEPA